MDKSSIATIDFCRLKRVVWKNMSEQRIPTLELGYVRGNVISDRNKDALESELGRAEVERRIGHLQDEIIRIDEHFRMNYAVGAEKAFVMPPNADNSQITVFGEGKDRVVMLRQPLNLNEYLNDNKVAEMVRSLGNHYDLSKAIVYISQGGFRIAVIKNRVSSQFEKVISKAISGGYGPDLQTGRPNDKSAMPHTNNAFTVSAKNPEEWRIATQDLSDTIMSFTDDPSKADYHSGIVLKAPLPYLMQEALKVNYPRGKFKAEGDV